MFRPGGRVRQGGLKAGASSSSGLHHDYHDNLYLLLRGRKRFRYGKDTKPTLCIERTPFLSLSPLPQTQKYALPRTIDLRVHTHTHARTHARTHICTSARAPERPPWLATSRLFSPDDAEKVYPKGELLKVHPNGRINYKGWETAPDGKPRHHHRGC